MRSTAPSASILLRSVLAATLALSVAARSPERTRLYDVDRIVGGNSSDPGDFPYFVDMGGCGGALIAPDVVLFAAHCGSDFLNQQINVGAYKPRSDDEGSRPRFCDELIADPDYAENPPDSDFALCKLDRPVDVYADDARKPVVLELNREDALPAPGDDLLVMGLGRLSFGGLLADNLTDVTVPALSNEECNRADRYQGLVTDTMLCAGYPETGGMDACQGDSGGPIVKRTIDEHDGSIVDTHVGVVSWGIGCAAENYPGVYGRTSKRYDWIVHAMCGTLGSVSELCENENGDDDDDGDRDFRCENGEQALTVTTRTDVWAAETSWLLVDEYGREVKRRKFYVNEHEYDVRLCLDPDRCYTWEILDGHGDGMCTPSGGCGHYSLTLQGEVIHSGDGDFGRSDAKDFCTASVTMPPDDEPSSAPSLADNGAPPSPCGWSNVDLEFTLHVQTDDRGTETAVALYSILPDFSDLGDLVLIDEDLEPNRLHVLPDDDADGGGSPLCLEDDRCYLFAITVDDLGGGAAMPEEDAAAGSFRGYLGGEEVFSGDEGGFGDYDDRMFCTGSAAIADHVAGDLSVDGVPTEEPTTGFPTQVPTTGFPTQVPTTGFPTQVPTTKFPTQAPTPEFTSRHPSDSPSAFPSAFPSVTPSVTPSASPSGAPSAGPTPVCEDDPDFAFRNRSRWNCKGYIKGRNNTARQIKRCNKLWDGKPVHDWCPDRCGSRVGVGPCAHLYEEKKGKAAKNIFSINRVTTNGGRSRGDEGNYT